MKKSLLLVLLSAIMLLAGCSAGEKVKDEGNGAGTNDVSGSVVTDIVTPEITATPLPTATPEPTATPSPTVSPTPTPVVASVSLSIPTKYTMPATKGGTIEKISYMAKDYLGDGPEYEKFAYVYLPPDYDESKQYNVLYLCHGIGGSENEWGLNSDKGSKVKRIMDNLIENGDIEPFIVVTPNGKAYALSDTTGNDLFYKFGYELRNDLIPYIESHYSTYAEYDENGYDLTATRTHRAMAGLSMGGMQTINIGMCECLDIFSWFGAFSAAPTSYSSSKVKDIVGKSEYTVDFFYNICGKDDNIAYGSASAAAKNLPKISDLFVENENFMWQEKGGGHDFNIWYLGFYNFAQIAFRGYIGE